MKRILTLALALALVLTSAIACDKKPEESTPKAEAAPTGPNPFQIRKDQIDDYMRFIEDAANIEGAVDAGQVWLDTNLEAYKENCQLLVAYRADPEKSKMAKGIETDHEAYQDRLIAKGEGNIMNAVPLIEQFNGFFQCDVALAQ